jgi:hypothetical protein
MKRIISISLILLSVSLFCWAMFLPVRAQGLPRPKSPAGVPAPCTGISGAALQPPFNVDYSCISLGSVSGVPPNYGGLTLKYNDPNILLIGGNANASNGRIYQISVVRGTNMHIVGFTGTATVYPSAGSTIGQNNDGGVVFGPGNVLFVARYPTNELEQTKPGSTAPDKVIDLSTIPGGGVPSSVGSLGFVPAGFPGAGQMKIVSYNSGGWYTAAFAPDGNGTYDITSITSGPLLGGGPEGIGFVPPGSPVFPPNSVLVAQYGAGKVITAPLDSNGDPIVANAQDFITGLSGVEGTFIDTVTGDLLFSTFGGGDQVVRVSGFGMPPVPTSAVSRKTHGAAGAFDVDLLSGPGIESRNGTPSGNDFTVVVTFASSVTLSGAIVTSSDNMATADPPGVSGGTVMVDLHNVSNAQRINVILINVNDGMRSGDVSIPMAILIGDANASAGVSAADIAQTKAQSGQAATGTNFRTDVNVSGGISAADIGLVKSKSGTTLPP